MKPKVPFMECSYRLKRWQSPGVRTYRQCQGFITEYKVPQERYVLHLGERKLKEDILDYNWTPKLTKPTVDAK